MSAPSIQKPPGTGIRAEAVALWVVGLIAVPAVAVAAVSLRPSLVVVGMGVAAIAAVVLVVMAPAAVVPMAWVLVVFIGLARKVIAGSAGHVENDPLIAAPYLLLVPLLFARIWWRSRYPAHLWLSLVFAGVVFGAFLIAVVQPGGASFGAIRAAVEQAVAPLCAVALASPALRGSVRATLAAVRWSAVVAAVYGIWQYVSPPRWDLRWLQNVVADQGIQTFGQPVQGQFRLFGPLNSPLAFAIVLSVGIGCWAFWSGRVWLRLAAIAVIAVPLLLTSVRTSVFALALALPIAVVLRYRQRALVPLVAIIAAIAAVPTVLEAIAPDLVTRFSIAALGSDTSYNARLRLLSSNLSGSLLGWGGGPGASSKGSLVTDNGYLAVFIDFGTLGGVVFVVVLIAALVASVRYALRTQGGARGLPLVLVLIYIFSEASAPVIQSQQGLVFWVTLAILGGDAYRRYGERGSVPADRGMEPAAEQDAARHVGSPA